MALDASLSDSNDHTRDLLSPHIPGVQAVEHSTGPDCSACHELGTWFLLSLIPPSSTRL